jgi:thioredoxin reductase (NADPH)
LVAEDSYDLVIVGAGLAGLTAGLIAARFGLKSTLIDPGTVGGQVLNVEKIENFPGFPDGIAGFDLGPQVQQQAEQAGCGFVMDTVTGLEINGEQKIVRCEGTELAAKAVIIAAGSALRSLGIPGEEEFLGRGVSHCASCDAPFYVGKEVCVVGGGDSALDEAAVLADQVARVTIFHRGTDFRAQQAARERLASKSNVETAFGTELVEIHGSDSVSSVVLRNNGETREQQLAGVFIFVGLEPNTAWLRGVVDLDPTGHVVTDIHLRTSAPGIFAAGDIRQASVAQLAAVAGDGATAAVNAFRFLKG